jgi:hypothetical protein
LQTFREQQKGNKKQIEMFKQRIVAHDAAIPVIETADAHKKLLLVLGVAQKSVHLVRDSLSDSATQLKISSGVA